MSHRERDIHTAMNSDNSNNNITYGSSTHSQQHDIIEHQQQQQRHLLRSVDNETRNHTPRSPSSDNRVLRCFCGCSRLNFEQIEQFAMMSVSGLVSHPMGKPLFRNFLKIGHRTDKSDAMVSLECIEICDHILQNLNSNHDITADVDGLLELCPSFMWETKINYAIENDKINHSMAELRIVLTELKADRVHEIQCHRDYDRFRKELLRKIGR